MHMTKEECPNVANHMAGPSSYIAWHEWADKKLRRHKQMRCTVCNLLEIWVRRDKSEPDYGRKEPTDGNTK